MVKGVSKQVVVVRSPDGEVFEQALFILNENSKKELLDRDAVLKLACNIADKYLKTGKSSAYDSKFEIFKTKLSFFAYGAGGMALIWLITGFFNFF